MNALQRNEEAYFYLLERGVLDDMTPQHQIDIQEAIRIASGSHTKDACPFCESDNSASTDNRWCLDCDKPYTA